MPVTKLMTTGTIDSMRSNDGNEGVDTFVRQTIGKEPLLSFSRAGESSVQWIQLLHALDQQGTIEVFFMSTVNQMEQSWCIYLRPY